MTIKRMDNVDIVVDNLEAVSAFFFELGLELEGETTVEGQWVDRIVGLDGVLAGAFRTQALDYVRGRQINSDDDFATPGPASGAWLP